MRRLPVTSPLVAFALGLLAAGCKSDYPAAPDYVISSASIDSLWLQAVDKSTVSLGISGMVPGPCSEFDHATVAFAPPNSYFIVPSSRVPMREPCTGMLKPYTARVELNVDEQTRFIYGVIDVSGPLTGGGSRTWEVPVR